MTSNDNTHWFDRDPGDECDRCPEDGHRFEEQPGEPPVDVCIDCGEVRE